MNNIKTMYDEFQFDNLHNFRDIGGLQTTEERQLKPYVIYRSDELSRLTQRDLKVLEAHQIKIIIDLRTANERKSKSDRLPRVKGLRVHHVPIHQGTQDLTHLEFFKFLVSKGEHLDFEQVLREFYGCMVKERKEEIKKVFTIIGQADKAPLLIHCTVGKDRTGFISALVQLLVGVSYETVVEHYERSTQLIAPRMKKLERFIRAMSLFRIPKERIQPLLGVKREYLDAVMDYIYHEYGTVEAYLVKGCGIEPQIINKVRDMILE